MAAVGGMAAGVLMLLLMLRPHVTAVVLQSSAADEARLAGIRGPQGLLRLQVGRGCWVDISPLLSMQLSVGRGDASDGW